MSHTRSRPPFRYGGAITDGYRTGHRAREVAIVGIGLHLLHLLA